MKIAILGSKILNLDLHTFHFAQIDSIFHTPPHIRNLIRNPELVFKENNRIKEHFKMYLAIKCGHSYSSNKRVNDLCNHGKEIYRAIKNKSNQTKTEDNDLQNKRQKKEKNKTYKYLHAIDSLTKKDLLKLAENDKLKEIILFHKQHCLLREKLSETQKEYEKMRKQIFEKNTVEKINILSFLYKEVNLFNLYIDFLQNNIEVKWEDEINFECVTRNERGVVEYIKKQLQRKNFLK